jgi:hypothetical protein
MKDDTHENQKDKVYSSSTNVIRTSLRFIDTVLLEFCGLVLVGLLYFMS